MSDGEGRQHDDQGWYDDGRAARERPAENPYRSLPPRVEIGNTVEEVDAGPPPDDPATDPAKDVTVLWRSGTNIA